MYTYIIYNVQGFDCLIEGRRLMGSENFFYNGEFPKSLIAHLGSQAHT